VRAWPAAIVLLAIGCAVRTLPRDLSPADASGTPPRSLRDGVYTVEQRRRGEEVYFTTCVRCHKEEMTGSQIVPPLIGETFLDRWRRKTAGDLFEWVRTSMPPGDAAAQMTRQKYADVLAYIFSRNDFPAGPGELAADFGALHTIRISAEPVLPDVGAASAAATGAQERPGP